MIVLGIDTATPRASVALVENDNLIAEEVSGGPTDSPAQFPSLQPKGNHAEIVLPLIQSVLARGNVSFDALSGLGVSIGPGSFTGLRIALATVKGLAYEWGVPVVGISTLFANAARIKQRDGVICSLMDARKREVYLAIYRRQGTALSAIVGERACSISAAIELLRETAASGTMIVGDGAKAYEAVLAQAFGASAHISAGDEFGSVAAQVAALSCERLSAGVGDDLTHLTPCYLRSSEAEKKFASRL
jgi:tRNA threonylcarbamoyladenosine biosynthesis protein TsaB